MSEQRSMWVNIYDSPEDEAEGHYDADCFVTREDADFEASIPPNSLPSTPNRIACVELKWTKGEGLND